MVPERYKDIDPEKTPEVFKKSVDKIKDSFGKGLFIFGGTGTGKTYALYALTVKFGMKIRNYSNILERVYNDLNNKYYYLKSISDDKYVVIDDIGTEKHTEYNQDILYTLINDVYMAKKRLFISTNLTPEEFEEKYGERIFSRLCEMCEFVEFTGPDKRI